MSKKDIHKLKIGVLGGGQLGLMMAQEASKLCLDIHFLDKEVTYPVSAVSQNITCGDYNNYDDVIAFGQDKDVITIEIENVNVDALKELEKKGVEVWPQSDVISIIKDKGLQKNFYTENKIPTSPYHLYNDKQEVVAAISSKEIDFPFVQKSRLAGYDGKGVTVIDNENDLNKIFDCPSVLEQKIIIKKELAMIIGRYQNDDISTFELTEMVFNPVGNLLDYLLCPADVDESITQECRSIATDIITKLDMRGILAVEFFLSEDNEIIVNEVAPRPHNSGHHTIEANRKSQYGMLLDIITNLPKVDNTSHSLSAIYNILGDKNHTGAPIYEGIDKVLSLSNTYVHLYNKSITKPLRKMGHVTVLADKKSELIDKINYIKDNLKVIS